MRVSFLSIPFFLLFVLVNLVAMPVIARNRIASDTDKSVYGDYIVPGDLIIDTPTKIVGGSFEIVYYFMAKQWPALREGGTIWIDGKKLPYLTVVKFCNTASATMPWHISTVRIKNIPGTQVVAQQFTCNGLKNFELDGVSEDHPGLTALPAGRKFLTGSFGFHMINKPKSGHGFTINVLDGGNIKMQGFEAQHGFSGVRINGGKDDIVVESVEIHNFYIHDTGEGEGIYLGATHSPPLAKFKNLKIYNGVITRTAAEALQLQHLAGGADVHHITIRSADTRWINAFRANQDTGIQWSVDGGVNRIHHIIVDGFANAGMIPFGSDQLQGGGTSEASYIFFNNGMDTGIYLHKSASFGVQWIFDNVYFANFTNDYYENTGSRERNYYVSSRNGSDQYQFRSVVHDGSKRTAFQNVQNLSIGKTDYRKLPEPRYVNSGFHEPAQRIKQWHPFYGGYFPASQSGKVKIPTEWRNGDIAIEVGQHYKFYKCISAHVATETPPSQNTNFIPLSWDENGVRSDQPEFKATLQQYYLPPDDLRLTDDCYWNQLDMGISK